MPLGAATIPLSILGNLRRLGRWLRERDLDDAHLKNWSFQWRQGELRPRLAPCYDLVASLTWAEPTSVHELSLPFAGRKEFVEVSRARIAEFARRAGDARLEHRFVETLCKAQRAWPEIREQAPPAMTAAVERLWENVPILQALGGLKRAG